MPEISATLRPHPGPLPRGEGDLSGACTVVRAFSGKIYIFWNELSKIAPEWGGFSQVDIPGGRVRRHNGDRREAWGTSGSCLTPQASFRKSEECDLSCRDATPDSLSFSCHFRAVAPEPMAFPCADPFPVPSHEGPHPQIAQTLFSREAKPSVGIPGCGCRGGSTAKRKGGRRLAAALIRKLRRVAALQIGAREIFGIFEDLRGIFGAFSRTFGNSWEIIGEPAGIFEIWLENASGHFRSAKSSRRFRRRWGRTGYCRFICRRGGLPQDKVCAGRIAGEDDGCSALGSRAHPKAVTSHSTPKFSERNLWNLWESSRNLWRFCGNLWEFAGNDWGWGIENGSAPGGRRACPYDASNKRAGGVRKGRAELASQAAALRLCRRHFDLISSFRTQVLPPP